MRKQKKQQRGASVRHSEPPRKRISFSFLYPVVLVGIIVAAAFALYTGAGVLLAKPVTRVAVTGEFRYVDRQEIAQQVQPFLAKGFVQLNLEIIRNDLKANPWVYDVNIARVWPDEISINVVEQIPIARWDDVGYLNHRGELFRPKKMIQMNELPLLSGPQGSTEQVMMQFQQFNEGLQQQGLKLQSLSLDQSGNWIAILNNRVSIVLGSTQIMEKMRRFVKTYKAVLKEQFELIERIDMRYSNGLAVAWKNAKGVAEKL